MSRARLLRIERLATVRARQLDAARGELAVAARNSEAARNAERAAEATWAQRAAALAATTPARVADLASASEHIKMLQRRVEAERVRRQQAEACEVEATEAVRQAHRRLRKLERWAEATRAELAGMAAKLERHDNDELAARIATGRSHVGTESAPDQWPR